MPWHFLYFLPLPQGQGWLRPIFCALPDRLATTAGWPPAEAFADPAWTPAPTGIGPPRFSAAAGAG